jgi:MoaA/NifB/PqqE/SkfB family radical SAM enzyme
VLSIRARKLRLAQAYLWRRPVLATWQLSRCGDLVCGPCEDAEIGGAWTDVESCTVIARSLGTWGSLVVSLEAGADPFLHPDLPGIVRAIGAWHLPVLTTAGWLVTHERARAVWAAGLVEAAVTFHAGDAKRHDAQSGVPGSHRRAFGALQLLAQERQMPWQSVVVRAELQGERTAALDDLVSLLEATRGEAVPVVVEPPAVVGGRPEDGAALARDLLALKRREPRIRNSVWFLAQVERALGGGVAGCRAGRRSLHIDYRGSASRCPEHRQTSDCVGSLHELEAEAVLGSLRRLVDRNGCGRCWRTWRGEVEGLYSWGGALRALPELLRR